MVRNALHAAMVILLSVVATQADKPAKIPVAFGAWTGPNAARFKSGLKSGVAKECVVVRAPKARVIIIGEVSAEEKHFKLRVTLKSPKTDEIVESKEYSFSKPQLSSAQSHKLGKDVFEMARRAPE